MNLALGSVIVFFLLTPGALFRLAYIQGPHHRGVRGSLSDEVVYSIIPAFLFQFIGIIVVEHWGFQVRLDLLFALIIGKSSITPDEFLLMKQALPLVFAYVLIINILSIYLGAFFRRFVLHTGLDLRFNFFKVYDDWYYAIFRLKKKNKKPGTLRLYINALAKSLSLQNHVEKGYDFIWIDILTKLDKEGLIYFSGFFEEYYLNKEGNIDRIELKSVEKRKFDQSEEEAIELGRDVFILPYSYIVYFNLSYYFLENSRDEKAAIAPELKANSIHPKDSSSDQFQQNMLIRLQNDLSQFETVVPESEFTLFSYLIQQIKSLKEKITLQDPEMIKDEMLTLESEIEDLKIRINNRVSDWIKSLGKEDLQKILKEAYNEYQGRPIEVDLIQILEQLTKLENSNPDITSKKDHISEQNKVEKKLKEILSKLIIHTKTD